MELVAIEFCNFTGYEPNFHAVKRIKNTKPQYNLSKSERLKNLSNAFQVNTTQLQNKRILLIDDICTTGSTFEELIKEFKKNGICDIVCFATTTPF